MATKLDGREKCSKDFRYWLHASGFNSFLESKETELKEIDTSFGCLFSQLVSQ